MTFFMGMGAESESMWLFQEVGVEVTTAIKGNETRGLGWDSKEVDAANVVTL